tara:strand:+ start:15212 stop:15664 length:453 start_codon:yes stop_codon:yes gene_type:complete
MSDIGLFQINRCFDIVVESDDLKPDDGLETAVAISVFSDKRVTSDDLPEFATDKKGWWGDMFPEVPNDKIGSRLWLLDREKTTNETLRRSEDFIKESLTWMLEDGVASDITVQSSYDDNNQAIPIVEISRPGSESVRYQVLWESQEIRRA